MNSKKNINDLKKEISLEEKDVKRKKITLKLKIIKANISKYNKAIKKLLILEKKINKTYSLIVKKIENIQYNLNELLKKKNNLIEEEKYVKNSLKDLNKKKKKEENKLLKLN